MWEAASCAGGSFFFFFCAGVCVLWVGCIGGFLFARVVRGLVCLFFFFLNWGGGGGGGMGAGLGCERE